MSLYGKEIIHVLAEEVGIPKLDDKICRSLAPDVEFRMRDIIEEAKKFAFHAKRKRVTTDDINMALRTRNVEPIYGVRSEEPPKFVPVSGVRDLFYLEDPTLSLEDTMAVHLPRIPKPISVACHWLSVMGIQPEIPANPRLTGGKRGRDGVDERGPNREEEDKPEDINVKLRVRDILSPELRRYYDLVTRCLKDGYVPTIHSSGSVVYHTLECLRKDEGIGQLVPYFVRFAKDLVTTSLDNLPRLYAAVELARSILTNPKLPVEYYLHQLMPALLTCVVAGKLGSGKTLGGKKRKYAMERVASLGDSVDDIDLRKRAASVVAIASHRFKDLYASLIARVASNYMSALLDPSKSSAAHLGCLLGVENLGLNAFHTLLMQPYEEPTIVVFGRYLRELFNETEPMTSDDQWYYHCSLWSLRRMVVKFLSSQTARSLGHASPKQYATLYFQLLSLFGECLVPSYEGSDLQAMVQDVVV